MPVSEDFRGFGEFSSNQPKVGDIQRDFVDAIGTRLMKTLNLQHVQKETSVVSLSSDSNSASDEVISVDDEEPTGVKLEKNIGSGKSMSKCTTFPSPVKGKSLLTCMFDGTVDSDDHSVAQDLSPDDHTQCDNHPYQRSLSLPTPSRLVSALKGSREKLGAPAKKLSVSWAPDVYDPIPTSASHVPSRSQRFRSNNKKNGKNKQKGGGKNTRGAKGKDKKKSRKYSGYSGSPSFTCMDNSLDMEDEKGPRVDFEIGKSDPFCGHSFLKNSVTRMHFPVAEAT